MPWHVQCSGSYSSRSISPGRPTFLLVPIAWIVVPPPPVKMSEPLCCGCASNNGAVLTYDDRLGAVKFTGYNSPPMRCSEGGCCTDSTRTMSLSRCSSPPGSNPWKSPAPTYPKFWLIGVTWISGTR